VLQAEGGGGSGVFLRWTTPTNTAYTDVPNANLRQITAAPAAPTGLSRSTTTNVGGVQIDFTDVAKNELRYELEKSTDNGANWTLVNSPPPSSASTHQDL
jgi:hypothetical protein